MLSAKLSYCAELIRSCDRARYICTLFAPAEVREAWFSLFAFDYEIERIAANVREEMVGFIRYAWWRETLEAIFAQNPPKGHPVAEALTETITHFKLPKALFEAIIDAHEKSFAEKEVSFASEVLVFNLCAIVAKTAPSDALDALATAWGALKAERSPHTDEAGRHLLLSAAHKNLELASHVPPMFLPFLHAARFCLKRLQRGKRLDAASVTLWLPLSLWLRHKLS